MAMTCAQFEEIAHELERPGTQGFALRDEALAHADSCQRCGLLFDKIMSLDFALDSLAVQDADQHAPARLETALIAEFRRQHAAVAPARWNSRVAAAALAMAATILLAVALVVPRLSKPNDNDLAMNSVTAAQSAQNAGVKPAVNNAEAVTAQENTAGDDSEYTTNFISLPYANDPGTLDGGTVVRVTLSRAALASFGVPVADLSSTERIPADTALSEDGVPQAIRLVASANLSSEN
jgi:hypothetical protein